MLANMPEANDYRPMHGRSKGHDLADGTHTRVKIDLFPEYIRHLPPQKRAVWDIVGRALCSRRGQRRFRAASGARARAPFRPGYAQGRHVSDPDPDPRYSRLSDHAAHRHALEGHHRAALSAARRSNTHIGTIFHEKLADGSLPKKKQMTFAPNTGYAFAVGTDTWHSADRGRSRSAHARQHPADLFRRCRHAALLAQSRQAASAISCSAKSATGCRNRSALQRGRLSPLIPP